MQNAQYLDGALFFGKKQDAVIANTQAKLLAWRPQLSDVPLATFQEGVDGAQYAERCFAIDSSHVGTCLRRPDDDLLRHLARLSGGKPELAQDLFVRDALALLQGSPGLIERRSLVR